MTAELTRRQQEREETALQYKRYSCNSDMTMTMYCQFTQCDAYIACLMQDNGAEG